MNNSETSEENGVPCQDCWAGDHDNCFTSVTFECSCAASGHPPGMAKIPCPET